MRGVGVMEFGGPEALQVVELPEVHAGPGEVRLRVYAATVNPTDTFVRGGARADALRASGPPPYIPGMDAAGVVDEVGEGTETDLQAGDAVMAMVIPSGAHGAYRESIVLKADAVCRAPAGASHAEASTLPMNALTARLSLDQLALEPGQTIAVTGAAGCYGGYMVQLAKADGLRVIGECLREGRTAGLRSGRGHRGAARRRYLRPDPHGDAGGRGRASRRRGAERVGGGRGARRWGIRQRARLARQRRARHRVPRDLGV